MSRIYTNTNKIKFTHISERYKVDKSIKGKLSQHHAAIITYVVSHFKDTNRYKQQIVDALNFVTYSVSAEELPPRDWVASNPFRNLPKIDPDLLEEVLGDVLLTVEGIEWDVKPTIFADDNIVDGHVAEAPSTEKSERAVPELSNSSASEMRLPGETDQLIRQDSASFGAVVDKKDKAYVASLNSSISAKSAVSKKPAKSAVISPTPKQDLYIQSPTIPQFDYNKPWAAGIDGADNLVIYTTLPEIPTKQNQVSVTTDVSLMTTQELMKLYPNCIIHTRASVMYEELDGVELDPDIGLIIPIDGFTREEIIDNIIRYPHIFKLIREVDGEQYSFYSHIEIEGQLHGTLDIWDSLPEAKILPRQAEFVKEYVVRRYLLERDVKHIQHKFPVSGTFDEFLTLFMPSDEYIRRGYKDVSSIVKQCVKSRVSYKQSRNPVLRRLKYV